LGPAGIPLKFYTEEGNYDLAGNNSPVFFIRDPPKFPDFIHTQKRNPQTNLPDPDMFWDFLSLTPAGRAGTAPCGAAEGKDGSRRLRFPHRKIHGIFDKNNEFTPFILSGVANKIRQINRREYP
jgi:hypothetical protein